VIIGCCTSLSAEVVAEGCEACEGDGRETHGDLLIEVQKEGEEERVYGKENEAGEARLVLKLNAKE
jgi:hypothetical protein